MRAVGREGGMHDRWYAGEGGLGQKGGRLLHFFPVSWMCHRLYWILLSLAFPGLSLFYS